MCLKRSERTLLSIIPELALEDFNLEFVMNQDVRVYALSYAN